MRSERGRSDADVVESLIRRGKKQTLAEAIRDLTTLHDSRGEGWDLVAGLLPLTVYRDKERRLDDADHHRARFTLVKGEGRVMARPM
jgi:hypothetical protein